LPPPVAEREQADRQEQQGKKDDVAGGRHEDDHRDGKADRKYTHGFPRPFLEEIARRALPARARSNTFIRGAAAATSTYARTPRAARFQRSTPKGGPPRVQAAATTRADSAARIPASCPPWGCRGSLVLNAPGPYIPAEAAFLHHPGSHWIV
jgi:hypothetical protein